MKTFGKLLAIILLAIFLLYACNSFEHQSPRYVKIAHEITNKVAKNLQTEKGLTLVGTGGQMMNDIQMLSMSFHLYHEVNLEAARKLIVDSANAYLKEINSNEEIRPYLHEYPFTAANVEVWLWLWKPDRYNLPPEKMSFILASNGEISYYANSPDPSKALCRETFEEAENKVNSNL
jgi:hypothetical protein